MKISFNPKRPVDYKNDMKVSYAPAKRKVSKIIWWAILACVFAPFVWLLSAFCLKWLMVTSPGLVTMETWTITAPARGTVEQVFVKEGDSIQKGTLLAEIKLLPAPENETEAARLRAELSAVRGAGSTFRPRASGGSDTSYLRELIRYLGREEDTMRRLMREGAATRAEYNQAHERLLNAKRDLAAVPKYVADPGADSARSRERYILEYLKTYDSSLKLPVNIYATRAGTVESIAAKAGEDADTGRELFVMADENAPYIIAYVSPEDYTQRIARGATANVKVTGSGRRFTAEVIKAPFRSDRLPGGIADYILGGRRTVTVWMKPNKELLPSEKINGLPLEIKWGMRIFK